MSFVDDSTCALNRSGLVAVKTCRADVLLKLCLRDAGIIFCATIFPEEIGGDKVDALVCALRRENRCDQQLKRVCMVERATRVHVCALEQADEMSCALFLFAAGLRSFQVSVHPSFK